MRRIGRLQLATGTAILAAWATFQTRAAFDHDFAKEKESKPSTSGRQANGEPAVVESAADVEAEAAERTNIEPATAGKAEPTVATQAEPANLAMVEPAACAKPDAPEVNPSPQTDGGASASLPSGG